MASLSRLYQSTFIALVFAGGAWAAWNGVAYAFDSARRYRAESAWFIFAAILLLFGFTRAWSRPSPFVRVGRETTVGGPSQLRAAMILIVTAVALYSPILLVGLLSDDFVLLDRARRGAFIDRDWDYVRPLPLLLWSTIDTLLPGTAVPIALHVLNVTLHGLNAWLVYQVATHLRLAHGPAMWAALLFLTWPFSVEPVSWASGIFDILLTTCVLLAVVMLFSAYRHAAVSVMTGLAVTAAATACKETAVALPLLLALLIPFVPASSRRTATVLTVACLPMVGAYVLWRVAWGMPTSDLATPSGYAVKELLSRPFGALGLGLHARILDTTPFIAALAAVLWPLLLTRSAISWHARPESFQLLVLGSGWVLCSVLPLFMLFYVGPDLQGSRYLYLGSTLWSVAIVATVSRHDSARLDRTAFVVLTAMVAASTAAVLVHQRPWVHAGESRDRVLSGLASLPQNCVPTGVTGLPDNIDGAYVFRNGFFEAIASTSGPDGSRVTPCNIHWDSQSFHVSR